MSSKHVALLGLAAFALGLGGMAMSACVGDDPSPGIRADAGGEATVSLSTNGQVCNAGAQCQSGQCVDGVCCDSACNGTCERCNLPGAVGRCEAVPDGEDPDRECPTEPLPPIDAGAPATDLDAGDAGEPDAAPVDAGKPFDIPDGAVLAPNDNQCAGKCNGKRACAYKGTETTCGVSFCGNRTEQGRASCDGKGHCLYGREECSAYACPDGHLGCKPSCNSPNDCLATHFCDGPSQTCKPKLANGIFCQTPDQCESGVCDTTGGAGGICCNVECKDTPGGTCRKSGSAGLCQCDACPTGACTLYYLDEDGDLHGDINATVANGRAKFGCEAGPPPTHTLGTMVKSHDDCFDSNIAIASSVHPGQTDFFPTPYTLPGGAQSFDYDCSGVEEQQTRAASCGFCSFRGYAQPGPPPPPIVEPQAGGFTPPILCLYDKVSSCSNTSQNAGHDCDCATPVNDYAYLSPVACGNTSSVYTCGKCTYNGGPSQPQNGFSKTQRCH